MSAMEMARFNAEWFLALILPAALMLFATYFQRKSWVIIGVVLSLVSTYTLCTQSVEKKWQKRAEIAKTEDEEQYAYADGANRVFTAFLIAPFESVLYTAVWGSIGWKTWARIRRKGAPELEKQEREEAPA